MYLYEVFQTWESLRQSSMLGKKDITQSELIAERMKQSEADIMSLVGGEIDQRVVQDTRQKNRRIIEAEVRILAERAQEIQAAIARGVRIILGIHEENKAFLRTDDSRLVDVPHDLECSYILRAPLPARFQSLPALPEGLLPVIDDSSRQKITEWPSNILPEYAGRRMECLRTMTASEAMHHVTKNWQYPYFLKTLAKNASMEIWNKDDLEAFFIQVKRDDDMYDSTGYIVSEVMNINHDTYGKGEFRAYIVGGKVANISRNSIDTGADLVSGSERLISEPVQIFCDEFASKHGDTFQTCVLDVAECADGCIRVVEMNDFCYSGRFHGNDFGTILDGFSIPSDKKTHSFTS